MNSAIADPGLYHGQYGLLNLAEDGAWIYTLSDELLAVQSLRGEDLVYDDFDIATVDGTLATISVSVSGRNDEALVDGILSDTIILAFEDTSAEGFVTVSDIDTGESGRCGGRLMRASTAISRMDADGLWLYQITNFDFPLDEEFFTAIENFELQTLGGDLFNIDITISEQGFIIG